MWITPGTPLEEVGRTAAAAIQHLASEIGWFISRANYNGMHA